MNSFRLCSLRFLLLSMVFFTLIGGKAVAQNLLPNASFEVNSGCPTFVAQIGNAIPWATPAGHGGSADYIHVCGTNPWVQVPNNAFGSQMPFQGNAYIGFALYYQSTPNFREYVQAPLTQTLLPGQTYEISTYYSLGDQSTFATDKLQFYFSNTPTTWGFGGWGPMSTYTPQCSIPSLTWIIDKVNWTRISATYTAVGGEQYVTIGNFLDDANTPTVPAGTGTYSTCYIYLDSVALRPINPTGAAPDTTLCPGICYQLWALGSPSYAWTTTTNPIPFSTSDSVVVCPTQTTTYIVTTPTFTDSVTVTVLPPPPSVTLGNDTTVCQGQTVTLNAGNPGASFAWTPTGATTQSITVGTTGNYQVVASNTCGTDSDAVVVTVEPNPTPNLGNDTSFCVGGSLLLNAGSGFASYAWSTSATTPTITVSSSGTYSVTVTTANGCTGSDAINVGVSLPLGLLVTGTNVSCNGGNNGTATAIGSGSPPLSYVWSAPGSPTTTTINGLVAGTYTVTVTDAFGCTRTGSITITQPTAFGTSVSATPESCPGREDGTATVSVSGGVTPYSYLWSNGGNTANIDSLAPGTFSVTVTDAQGCTATNSITIAPGAGVYATTVGNPSFCEGDGGDTLLVVGSGGIGPYYYQWWCNIAVGPCGLDSIFDDDPLANPTVSGWYYVQVTDASGCQSEVDSVWVTVLPKPIVDAGPDAFMCGDSAPCHILTPTISGVSGPYTYHWSPSTGLNDPNIANPCARPDTTTIYSLVVTAGNGCTSDFTTTDTLATVTVNVNPIPIADAGPDLHVCYGDSVLIQGIGTGAGPLYTYEWSPTSGLAQPLNRITMASPALTTTYTLVAYSNDCPSYGDDVTVFVHTVPTVDAGADREICLGDSILIDAMAGGDSTASYGFTWTPGSSISDVHAEDPTVWPVSTTMYHVEASSNYGCGSSFDSVLVTLLPTPIANAGDNATVCLGNEFQFQGSYSYTTTLPANPNNVHQFWTPDAGMSDGHSLTPTMTPQSSMLYTLTVYTGLCSTKDSMLLTVIPELDISALADTSVICAGDSVGLQAIAAVSSVTFTWSPSGSLSNAIGANTVAAPSDSSTFAVMGDLGGCKDTAYVQVNVIPTPRVEFLYSQPHGCAPLAVSFLQNVSDAIFYFWNFGDGSLISNELNPTHVYAQAGTYPVSLSAVNTGGCMASQQGLMVQVGDTARVDFHSDPSFPVELSLPNTMVHFFHDAPDAVTFDWNFGDGLHSAEPNPVHSYAQPGTYLVTLRVTNAEGCVSVVTKGPFVVKLSDLFIPNVFSPNNDGINDEFVVQYTGNQPFTLQIFDRWGVKVYDGTNKTKGWRGTDVKGNPLAEGVYYYRIRVGDRDFAGPVTMVR